MHTKMPIGISDFKQVREGYYFVDKTDFIKRLIDGHNAVTLFTRPRRFGKTLTMSMLDYFFSLQKKDISTDLFKGLAIEKAGSSYMIHHGQYPVIFTTLKDFYNPTWDSMYRSLRLLTQEIYTPFSYVLESPHLVPSEKEYIRRILDLTAEPEEYQLSLKRLSSFLYKHYHIRPIILIDEYDAPLQTAYNGGFYDDAIRFWQGWYNATLKDNSNLQFAVLTGVLRIAKESIFSGMNNLDVYSVLSRTYSDVFGFTAEEVQQIARDLHHTDTLRELKTWYDGYTFGQKDIYNPWSVINYFAKDCRPEAYWVNTSSNAILRQLLQQARPDRLQALQDLLDGHSITTAIDEGVIYTDVWQSDTSLYSVMLNTGYLKAIHCTESLSGMELYDVKIPNEEIKRIYKREILGNMVQGIDMNLFLRFQLALLQGKGEKVNHHLQEILLKMVSFYDTKERESFYHGLLLGMTCLLESSLYHVESNRESGYGRFDIAVFPTNPQHCGIILEFKVASSEKDLFQKAQEALRQIEDRAYISDFEKRGIPKVWKYGIAFHGKHVKVIHQ